MHVTGFFVSILKVDCTCNFYCLRFTIHFSQIEPSLLDGNDKSHPGDNEHDVQSELDDSGYVSLGQKRRNPTSLLDIEYCQRFCCLKCLWFWKKDASSPAFPACACSYSDLAVLTICGWGSHFDTFRVLWLIHIQILSPIFNKTLLVLAYREVSKSYPHLQCNGKT